MVLLFLIVNVQGEKPLTLFHKYFDQLHTLHSSDVDVAADRIRRTRREQVTRTVKRLHSMYQFNATTNPRSFDFDLQILNNDDAGQDFDVHTFRLTKDDPFTSEMRVFWLSVQGFVLAFVCHPCENRLQAELTLRILTRQLHEATRFVLQPNIVLSKPEKVNIVISKFIPNGHFLFMNHRLVRQLERETEVLLKVL